MKNEGGWKLSITASRKDGTLLLFEPASGAHAHVKELVDSEQALVEFTLVVPRMLAEVLHDALTVDELVDDRRSVVYGD